MCKVNSSLYYVQKTAAIGRQPASGQTHWIPNTDVYASEGHLVIKVELAGMRREDLELTVEGNRLMISARVTSCLRPRQLIKTAFCGSRCPRPFGPPNPTSFLFQKKIKSFLKFSGHHGIQ